MSVKVAIPRDIESSFDSSITMPDTVTGEQEWQDKEQRLSLSSPLDLSTAGGLGLLADAIMTSDAIFILDRKGVWYYLSKYSSSGSLIASVKVLPKSEYSTSIPRALSLSGGVISVGRSNLISSQIDYDATYEFDLVDFSVSDLSEVGVREITEMNGNIAGKDRIERGFRFNSGVFLCSVSPSDAPNTTIIESYVEGVKIAELTPLSTINFTAINGRIVTIQRSSRSNDNSFFVDVNYYDYSFNHLDSKEIEVYSPDESRPVVMSISTNEDLLTILSRGEHDYQFAVTQLVDFSMINIGAYRKGDEVIKSSTARKYRCAVNATFDDPEIGVSLLPPAWSDIGSANRFAILDSNTSQRSLFTNSGSVSCFVAKPVDTVGIFGLSGVEFATVSVIDGGVEIYSETKSGLDSEFADVEIRDITFSIPPLSDVDILVSFEGESIRVGRFAVGVGEMIGRAVAGTELGDIDYSILEFDEFGNTRYVPRPIVSFHTFQVDVDKQKSLSVARKLQSVGGKDAMWSADVGLSDPLVALGKCERFPITYDNPTIVSYSLKIRGTA